MNNFRIKAGLLLVVALLAGFTLAQTETSLTAASVADSFVTEAGYEAVDLDNLEALIEAGLPPSESVFTAAGQLSPLVKAVHALEALDGQLDRTRFMISVAVINVTAPPAADPEPLLLVQVDRFNLGPSIHAELVQSVGEDQVAQIHEFGEGPHVSWRLVMQQLMGQESALVAAGRLEIPAEDALNHDCFAGACLQTASLIDELAVWSELTDATGSTDSAADVLTAAGMLAALADMTSFSAYEHEAGFDAYDSPVVVARAVVETNLAQDSGAEGALRIGELRDDSLEAMWARAAAFPGADGTQQLFGAVAYECRRGAAEGGLCL